MHGGKTCGKNVFCRKREEGELLKEVKDEECWEERKKERKAGSRVVREGRKEGRCG